MIFRNLLGASNPIRVKSAVVAGTTDTQTFTEVDMLGFTGVIFLAVLGTVTSTGIATLRAKGSNVSNSYGAGTISCLTDPFTAAIVSAVNGDADSNTILALDINRPGVRYVRGEIVRATANIVIQAVVAIPYNSEISPSTLTGMASAGATPGYAIVANPNLSAT